MPGMMFYKSTTLRVFLLTAAATELADILSGSTMAVRGAITSGEEPGIVNRDEALRSNGTKSGGATQLRLR